MELYKVLRWPFCSRYKIYRNRDVKYNRIPSGTLTFLIQHSETVSVFLLFDFRPLERRSKAKNGNVLDLILQIHSDVCRHIDISIFYIFPGAYDISLLLVCTRILWNSFDCVIPPNLNMNLKTIIIGSLVLKWAKFFFTLDAGLLARSQYSEGPATGHLDTGFSWFPYVYKQMLRWFPIFQVATTCFSCSPPDLNLLVTNFIFCIHAK